MARPTKRTPVGPLSMSIKKQPLRWRSRRAAEGSLELFSRVGKRLGIPAKEAESLLKIVGLEMAQLAYEGWIFSLPNFGSFWIYTTKITKRPLIFGKDSELTGGNNRVNFTEHSSLINYLKRNKKETNNETVSI